MSGKRRRFAAQAAARIERRGGPPRPKVPTWAQLVRRKAFEVTTPKQRLTFPFARLEVQPRPDQTNYRKSVDQMLRLLQVLDCDVDLVVQAKSA